MKLTPEQSKKLEVEQKNREAALVIQKSALAQLDVSFNPILILNDMGLFKQYVTFLVGAKCHI
jgi:hypothetical protein